MRIELVKKIGEVDYREKNSVVKAYRNNPSDIVAAIDAAHRSAVHCNENMIVIVGNSYMASVYHVAKESDDLLRYTVMDIPKGIPVCVVHVNGSVYTALAFRR